MAYIVSGWSTLCSLVSFTLLYTVVVSSFSFLHSRNTIYYTTVYPFYYSLAFGSLTFWGYYKKVLLQIFSSLSFAAHIHACLLNRHLRVEWLGLRVCVCLTLGDTAKQISKVVLPTHISFRNVWKFEFLPIPTNILNFTCHLKEQ